MNDNNEKRDKTLVKCVFVLPLVTKTLRVYCFYAVALIWIGGRNKIWWGRTIIDQRSAHDSAPGSF